jgi:hypothetical protein
MFTWAHYIHVHLSYISGQNTYIYVQSNAAVLLGRDKILCDAARRSGGRFLRVLLFLPLVIVWMIKEARPLEFIYARLNGVSGREAAG